MEKVKLTSVKVNINEQYKFKKICLENGMNFQKEDILLQWKNLNF